MDTGSVDKRLCTRRCFQAGIFKDGRSHIQTDELLPPLATKARVTDREDVDRCSMRLPQELIDGIIECLHDDRTALGSCALVCRCWVDPCRTQLFRTLKIANTSPSTVLARLKESPYLCYYIRRLDVVPCGRNQTLCAPLLSAILAVLPRINTLNLSSVHITSCSQCKHDTIRLAPNTFNLGRLTLTSVTSDILGGLLSIISLFSDVHELAADGLHWEQPSLFPSPRTIIDLSHLGLPHNLQVHSLRAEGKADLILLSSALRLSAPMCTLQIVRVSCADREAVGIFGDLLQVVGSHIKHVIYNPMDAIFEWNRSTAITGGEWRILGLQHCIGLQHLTLSVHALFGFITDRAIGGNQKVLNTVHDILLQTPRTTQYLTIRCTQFFPPGPGPHHSLYTDIDWTQLERLLCKFTNLQDLTFTFCGTLDGQQYFMGDFEDAAREGLPRLHAKGILRVTRDVRNVCDIDF